jgi:hypothetical protein
MKHTMKTHKEQIELHRQRHHKALEALAMEVGCNTEGLKLWRQLARLEAKLYAVCMDYTNGDNGVTLETWEQAKDEGRKTFAAIFGGSIPKGAYLNGDPRGHMARLRETGTLPNAKVSDGGGL